MNAIRKTTLHLQRGFTAIEMIVVMIVSIAALALGGQWMGNYSDNMLNQSAAEHAKSVSDAATRYIKDNYSAVTAVADATTPASITVAMLKSTNYLPSSFSNNSPYGQSYSILALEPVANQLQTLIVTTGGDTIGELNLRRVAQLIGAKGGYISSSATTSATGSYGGWTMPLATYGVSPGAGHIAVALFFQDGSLVSDYVYRNAVAGHPELNTMNTPLIMAAVNTLNGACTTLGAISRDATGKVLSCDGTNWKSQGSAYWEDPVDRYTDPDGAGPLTGLPTCNAGTAWQTRVVRVPTTGSGPRAYTCDGGAWRALALDDNGALTIPGTATLSGLTYLGGASATAASTTNGVMLNITATEGTACPNGVADNGKLAKDATGLILSCQSGGWSKQRFRTITSFTFSGQGVSNGATTGYHDLCTTTGIYQNGNNGWLYMTASAPNATGKRNYTVTSTCAVQGCDAGALNMTVDCLDF